MKWITDNLALISIGLLIIGFTKQIAYYQFFGVDIVSYLDTTEILQLEFKFFAISFVAILWLVINGLELLKITNEALLLKVSKPNIVKEEVGFWRRNLDKHPFLLFRLFVLIVSFGVIFHDRVFLHLLNTFNVEIFIALLFLNYVYGQSINVLTGPELTVNDNARIKIYLIILFIAVLIGVVIFTRRSAYNILTKKPDKEAVLVLEKRTISTDSSTIYIGKTRNYVFLYNKDKELAEVIPADKIEDSYFSEGKPNTKLPNTFKYKDAIIW